MLIAAGVVSGCDAAVATPSPTVALVSGIRGTVLVGPTCPVEPSDGPACVSPYATTIAILDDDDQEVATVRSGSDGRFEVRLPPGHYLLIPASGDPLPMAEPIAVTVESGAFAEVEINYDSGIR